MIRIAILGMGLIGTSLGIALRNLNPAESPLGEITISGYDRDPKATREARGRLAIDTECKSLAEAVRGANLVVIATPVGAIEEILRQVASQVALGTVITDVASTKAQVGMWAARHLPTGVIFLGGHPMAGRERSGPAAAEGTLFQEAIYCLTPSPSTPPAAIELVEAMVRAVGAKPYYIDPEEHDAYVAGISHLPFLLSSALVEVTGRSPAWKEMAALAATGFRDASRLASGDPAMYRDICLTNRTAIDRWVRETTALLGELNGLVQAGDGAALEGFFTRVREQREDWLESKPNLRPGENAFTEQPEIVRPNLFSFGGRRRPPRG